MFRDHSRKVFEQYRDEIPYSTEVIIAEFKERENAKDYISAEIVVEKETQKPIILGAKGDAIKRLGQEAREAIEKFLQHEVYLELRVKVREKWRSNPTMLKVSVIKRKMNKLSQKSSGKFIGEAALLLMTIIWGGTFVIVKESLDDISTLLFVGLRFGIAAVVLFIVLYLKKIKIDKKIILPGALLGGWLFLGFLTQTAGLKFTSASKSGFLTGSLVVMIPLFQTIIEKKYQRKGHLSERLLCFLELCFYQAEEILFPTFFNNLGNNFNIGDWLTLMCAAFFALHIVFMDIISPKYEFWNLLFFQLVTVAILNLFFSVVFSFSLIEPFRFSLSKNLLIGILYTALLSNFS